ncbi:hypothetical protein AURDEDRAFT_166092 [Auricularia subglabra TFB-10046 SS5]|nr:hypothetical protein AURDEDRAFT_166092 [Auricularia subglabra TFB-10046 SS5]
MLVLPFLLFFAPGALASARPWSSRSSSVYTHARSQNISYRDDSPLSLNVGSCPGYKLDSVKQDRFGLTAHLTLAGAACNAFGNDYTDLTIEVTYESSTRSVSIPSPHPFLISVPSLHVLITDASDKQFVIPQSVIERPAPPTESFVELVFNYESNPFAFWITRRDEPDGMPLFDTRIASLPKTPVAPVREDDPSTALDGFPLVFEDQYLQLTSALPLDANVHGLGEVLASSGFRRELGGKGTVQAFWSRDRADPFDENLYGSHPIYMEHRLSDSGEAKTHGVFLMSAAAADILLLTPPDSPVSLVQYRLVGGALDFYFMAGPSPVRVIEQYAEIVGLPTWQPYWGFGFHLSRWGYNDIAATRDQVNRMREANIPLETIWNDIDLYHNKRDFTTDPANFPGDQLRAFIKELADKHQHYIPIVDAGIARTTDDSDVYEPWTKGVEQNVFMTNPDGSLYIGEVWPGKTAFPDWFAEKTQGWWTDAFRKWRADGVEWSGIWLDMNEVSSFCDGSCGSNPSRRAKRAVKPRMIDGWTRVNASAYVIATPGKRDECDAEGDGDMDSDEDGGNAGANRPPIEHHGVGAGFGPLGSHGVLPEARHAGGYAELDVHNMWGLMEERATHNALRDIQQGQRPFIISRSTFPSSGRWTGHWLGDNLSGWEWLYASIQGVLQFQLFQIPMVGADACGFIGDTNEELCNRWMQLAAFTPFYRNHNVAGTISQEPYVWESVAEASRKAMAVRYKMLPYWYTLFADSSRRGTPPMRALWYEFPTEKELFGVDRQFLIGPNILVSPVVDKETTSVDAFFPGVETGTVWRDWYTHAAVGAKAHEKTALDAPLGHINVHIRSGSAILLHGLLGYTTAETREGPYELLVSLDRDGTASGTAYIDDGISYPPGPSADVSFAMSNGTLIVSKQGDWHVERTLDRIKILGLNSAPRKLSFNGQLWDPASYTFDESIGRLDVPQIAFNINNGVVMVLE